MGTIHLKRRQIFTYVKNWIFGFIFETSGPILRLFANSSRSKMAVSKKFLKSPILNIFLSKFHRLVLDIFLKEIKFWSIKWNLIMKKSDDFFFGFFFTFFWKILFGQKSTVFKWNYQILCLHPLTDRQKLGKWFK